MTEDWGFLIGLGGVVTFAYVIVLTEDWRTRRRIRKPPPKGQGIPLAADCSSCGDILFGHSLSDEQIESHIGPFGQARCNGCGSVTTVRVEVPWTRGQRSAIESERRRNEERRLVSEYEEKIRSLEKQKEHRLMSEVSGLLSLSPVQFEHGVAKILRGNGYTNVSVCGGPGDLTADIECTSPKGNKTIVQCKRYAPDHPVGSKEIQTFIGMLHRHHKVRHGLYVTTSRFTNPARDLAKRHRIELWDAEVLGAKAAVIAPRNEGNEEEKLAAARAALAALPMWKVVQDERAEAERKAALEKKRDQIRRARLYGSTRRY